MQDSILYLLQRYGAGFCIFDMPGFTCPLVATTNFSYFRFHGSQELYSSSYSEEELSRWSQNIVQLAKNLKEVYIYFNNDAKAYAVENARKLRQMLAD
jgi:uncharacterized protein YecE (DUF72 family)